jgi:hypothetical protein
MSSSVCTDRFLPRIVNLCDVQMVSSWFELLFSYIYLVREGCHLKSLFLLTYNILIVLGFNIGQLPYYVHYYHYFANWPTCLKGLSHQIRNA